MKGSCLLPVLTVLGGAQGNLEAHLGLAPAKCPPRKHTLGPAEKSPLALGTPAWGFLVSPAQTALVSLKSFGML